MLNKIIFSKIRYLCIYLFSVTFFFVPGLFSMWIGPSSSQQWPLRHVKQCGFRKGKLNNFFFLGKWGLSYRWSAMSFSFYNILCFPSSWFFPLSCYGIIRKHGFNLKAESHFFFTFVFLKLYFGQKQILRDSIYFLSISLLRSIVYKLLNDIEET